MENNLLEKKLFAGGSGLLGTNLTMALSKYNSSVRSSYFSTLPPNQLKHLYVKYDFCRFEDCLNATKNIDILFFVINSSGIKGQLGSQTSKILPNLQMLAGMLEAACLNQVKKIVWISSASVYQESYIPISEDAIITIYTL